MSNIREPFVLPLQRCLQRTLPSAFLEISPVPGIPSLQLALINADFDTGPLEPDVMRRVIAEPAYWAFCWGSGLALAQWLLDEPWLVAGRRVLDFGSGSGIAGLAAAKAGAETVTACDSDPDAQRATLTNAVLNEVEVSAIGSLARLEQPVDLVLVADVLYDRANLELLETLEQLGAELLIADSRIDDLSDYGYQVIGQRSALTTPNLGEFDEFKTVRFFRAESSVRALAPG